MLYLLLSFLFSSIYSYSIKDKFCGNDNCFTILNIQKNASLQEIKKSFRELSKIHHPDKIQDYDNTSYYRKIVQAYEVLSNEDTKQAYLDYLSNPNRSEFYYHYNYYKHVYHPQSNPYIVVTIATLLLSLIQYVCRIGMYKNALKRVMETTHFKTVLKQRMAEQNEDRDTILQQMLQDVNLQGAWSYPKMKEIWFIAFLNFFYSILYRIYFQLKWKRMIKKNINPSYDDASYKTRLLLNLSESRWESMPNKDEYIDRELWVSENWDKFMEEQRQYQEQHMQRYSNKIKIMKRMQKKSQ